MLNKLKALFSSPPPKPRTLATSEDATAMFADLFRGHGLPVELRDGWIVAQSGCLLAQARVHLGAQRPAQSLIQLDLEVVARDGSKILESALGIGENLHEAIRNGVQALAEGSFHVIFAALTGQSCSHCDQEEWTVAGLAKTAYIGPVTGRGGEGAGQPPSIEWYGPLEAKIRTLPLGPGLHWFRFYHAEPPGSAPISEALANNLPHPELEALLAAYAWPKTGRFYSIRLFIILGDRQSPTPAQGAPDRR